MLVVDDNAVVAFYVLAAALIMGAVIISVASAIEIIELFLGASRRRGGILVVDGVKDVAFHALTAAVIVGAFIVAVAITVEIIEFLLS
jgi:hypothetical protein